MKRIFLLFVVSFFLFTSSAVNSAIFDVSSPDEFQAALDAAAGNGEDDTIYVAAGTYDLTIPLQYSPGALENYSLTIQGAGADVTFLNGMDSGQILILENSNLASGEGGTDDNAHQTIRGLTFANGSAIEGGGVGMYTGYANITLEDCVFAYNYADYGGGAFLSASYAIIALTGNTFYQNSTAYDAGGAFVETYREIVMTNNTFSQNTAQSSGYGGGGGAYISGETVTLSNNGFFENANTGGEGGGAFIWVSGDQADATPTLTLTNNSFANNSAYGSGGGLYLYAAQGLSSNPPATNLTGNSFNDNSISASIGGGLCLYAGGAATLNQNAFGNNSSPDPSGGAGGAYVDGETLSFTNNVFSGNAAGNIAGGLHIYLRTELNLINNTIVNNQANQGGGGIYFEPDPNSSLANAYNNIIWGNTAATGGDFYSVDDNLSLTINYFNNDVGDYYSLCDNNPTCTTTINSGNNINSDPLLSPDFHLTQGSPCINAGDNNAPSLPSADFEGDDRILRGIVDLGADESTYSRQTAFDFNGDGMPDLIWRNASTGRTTIWYMDGATWNGGYADLLPTVSDPDWTIVGVADFNGDFRPDILWRNTATGRTTIWYMNGPTWNGEYADVLPEVGDPNWSIVGIADFNGDSNPDLLWRDSSTGRTTIWYMNGATWNGGYADVLPTVADPNWSIVGIADFNGDSNPDLLWRDSSTGRTTIWYMTGPTWNGGYADVVPTVSDPDWQIVAIRDFNNDGSPDLLWRNTMTSRTTVWYMDGPTWNGNWGDLLPLVSDPDWILVGR